MFVKRNNPHSTGAIIRYGRFRVDTRRNVLYENDEEVNLELKPLKIFQYLIENLNEWTSIDDLLAEVWKDSIVEPANVTQSVYKIRQTLGEDRFLLESRRKIGYRLRAYTEGRFVTVSAQNKAALDTTDALISERAPNGPELENGTRPEITSFLLRESLTLDHLDDYIELESDERGWVHDEVEFRCSGVYDPPQYIRELREKYKAAAPIREYFSFYDAESRTRDEEHKLIIFVEGGDWRYVYAFSELHKHLQTDPLLTTLRAKCEAELMPGGHSRLYRPVACHVVVISSDNKIILCRRRKNTRSGHKIPFYPGAWAVSLEENALRRDPNGETAPDSDLFACVERGVKEELKIEVRPEDTRLLSYGIEWHNFAAAFVFMAKTDADYETIAKCWRRAKDRAEAIAIDNIPADAVAIRSALVRPEWSPSTRAKTWTSRGAIAKDYWHGTSRARLLSYLRYLQRD